MPTRQRLILPSAAAGAIWYHGHAQAARRQLHRHEELELNLVVSGRASYLAGGRRYELCTGSQMWLFPDQDHVLLGDTPDFRMWIIVWKPGIVRKTCRSAANRILRRRLPPADWQFCKRLGPAATRQLATLIQAVNSAAADPDRRTAGLAYVLLAANAEHAAADALNAESRAVHPAVKEAARLLRDDPEAVTIKLPELADRAGLSPSRLSRLFKAETGVALVHFRQRMQLDRFLALYDGGRIMKLLPAALAAGFGSYPQFYRVHKRLLGRAPGLS